MGDAPRLLRDWRTRREGWSLSFMMQTWDYKEKGVQEEEKGLQRQLTINSLLL